MRRNAKHNSILNSPIVRSLIKPVTVPTPAVVRPPPKPEELISTQPPPTPPGSASPIPDSVPSGEQEKVEVPVGGKRKREKGDEGEREQGRIEVSYTADNLPHELRKYWNQRYRLFSRFDEGCRMDLEGWYSVTPELVAAQIAERCRSGVVLDAFCGVGGNAIQFAFTCERVIAIDTSPVRLACAAHNAGVYGVADRITFILGDFLDYASSYAKRKTEGTLSKDEEVEVVFLSPPWGGIDYREAGSPMKKLKPSGEVEGEEPAANDHGREKPPYPLSALAPIHGADLFHLARGVSPHVAYYLPRNVDLEEVAALAAVREDGTRETVEVEEEWTAGKMKAVTAYFGDLVVGR